MLPKIKPPRSLTGKLNTTATAQKRTNLAQPQNRRVCVTDSKN